MSCPTWHETTLTQSHASHLFNSDMVNASFRSSTIKRLSHACTAAQVSDKQEDMITAKHCETHTLQLVVAFFQYDTKHVCLSKAAFTKWSSWVTGEEAARKTTQETEGNRKIERVRPAKGSHWRISETTISDAREREARARLGQADWELPGWISQREEKT